MAQVTSEKEDEVQVIYDGHKDTLLVGGWINDKSIDSISLIFSNSSA